MDAAAAVRLSAGYFDGLTAREHAVHLEFAPGALLIDGGDWQLSIPLSEVQWPERTRHGKRVAHFSGGGLVQSADAAAWDAWYVAGGQRESLVVSMQQNWRSVCVSALLLLGLLGVVYVWGLPLLAGAVVSATPLSVDSSLGETAMQSIDGNLMQASELSAAEQQRITAAWTQTVQALPAAQIPAWRLEFRKSRIGPNAFALPGGTILMTDELVKLVDGDTQVLSAVLAHEMGHLHYRHGLRMVVQVGVLGSITSLALGDFSGVLAALPALLGQANYSRQAEHQADVYAVQVLKAAHISPAVMVTLFDKFAQERRKKEGAESAQESLLGIGFASHPSDAERIAFFTEAAR